MSKYADVDELVAELNRTYKGYMPDLCMSPLGTENWLMQRARRIPDPLPEYRAPQNKVSVWEQQVNKLHAAGDLASTIKELAVICADNEKHHMDHLQTVCFRRALGFLVSIYGGCPD